MQGSGCYWCKLWSYTLSASIFKEFCKGSAYVPWLFSEAGCYQEKPEGKSNPQTEISNMENQALEEAGSKYTHNQLTPCHRLLTSSTVKCTSACAETLCKASAGYNYSIFSCCTSIKQHTAGTYSRLLTWCCEDHSPFPVWCCEDSPFQQRAQGWSLESSLWSCFHDQVFHSHLKMIEIKGSCQFLYQWSPPNPSTNDWHTAKPTQDKFCNKQQ